MDIKKYIPNYITLLNLFCGCLAVLCAVNSLIVFAAIFVCLGIFFDFFDGFFARKFKVQSELGLQLDSLADMVTSGLVPGIVMYKLIAVVWDKPVVNLASWSSFTVHENFNLQPVACIGLLITVASAYRLAKFNIDEDQQNYFKGLPTPANALLILSFPLILEFQNNDLINSIILNKWFLILVSLISCYLLNSSLKLFALKFKNFQFKDNATRYLFLILALVLLVVLQFAAIPIIIIIYILISVFNAQKIY